jgi:mono/diheme cytochrome c family protein
LTLLLPALPAAGRAADGPALFADNCVSCHGPDGRARTPAGRKVHAKDLTLSKLTDAEIERQIREGTKDSRGLATMPAFKDQLSDAEITALVPVVKSFRK